MTALTEPRAGGAAVDTGGDPYLVVENLTVKFPTEDGLVNAVSDLSYTVELGKTLGIVGESGSGKSVSSMAVLGLHDVKRSRITGSIRVGGTEIIGLPEKQMNHLRGNEMAMIFQDALAALHPFYRVGDQLVEAYALHHPSPPRSGTAARRRSRRSTGSGSRSPTRASTTSRTSSPGGMRQRVMIAMGLINSPACSSPTSRRRPST